MVQGYPGPCKLCTIDTLPSIQDPLNPPQLRIVVTVIGRQLEHHLALVADPLSPVKPTSKQKGLLVNLENVVARGGQPPLNLKDTIMIWGQLTRREDHDDPTSIPRVELHLYYPHPQIDPSLVLEALQIVVIEEGRGSGLSSGVEGDEGGNGTSFDRVEWDEAVKAVQRRQKKEDVSM